MPTLPQRLRRRVTDNYRRTKTHGLRVPSYTYKQLEMRRVRRVMRELGCKDPAFLIDGKTEAHEWAVGLGVRVPKTLATYSDIRATEWDQLPGRIVVKPCRGTTGTGVLLLVREGTAWRELQSRRTLGQAEIEQEFLSLVDAGAISGDLLVEDLVCDPRAPEKAPIDYKVSTFYGTVGMIEVKSHDWETDGAPISTWRVFDSEWRDLGNPFNEYRTDASIQPAVHAGEMLELASRISIAVPRPYIRVDLFEDVEGPLLGELTPEPGGDLIVRPDVDRLLGRIWEEAEARLRVRASGLGILNPEGLPRPTSREDPTRSGSRA